MRRLICLSILLAFSVCQLSGQGGYLFVKKGRNKKKTYTEGQVIMLTTHTGRLHTGYITMLRNDTIFLNGSPIAITEVSEVIIRYGKRQGMKISANQILLVAAGTAMTTAGLTISGQTEFKEALIAGAVIGFGQLGVQYLGSRISLRRKKFRIGKKFRLQIIDFHLPGRKAF